MDDLFIGSEDKQRSRRRRRFTIGALIFLLLIVFLALLIAGNAILGNPLALPVATEAPASTSPTPVLTYSPADSPLPELPNAAESPTPGPALDVYFIDVGQGDAILLRSPNGKFMLVDAGEPGNFDTIDALLKELGAKRLDVVVSTHAHSDHAGSMAEVIRAYPIKQFYLNAESSDGVFYQDMLEALEEERIRPITTYATMLSTIYWDKDVTVRILAPYETARYDDLNESSIVLHIQYGITSVLLTADTGALAERLMLKALPNVYFHSSVLKLGHHGSYSSTTEKFLETVNPLVAIASCGRDNPYGHPDEAVQALLAKHDIPLLTTAEYGTIHIILDGSAVRVVE